MSRTPSNPSKRRLGIAVALLAVAAGSIPSAAPAQSAYRLFDDVSVVVGGYFETTDAELRLDGSIAGANSGVPIDLESDLGLDSSDTLLRARVEFLAGERHQFNFGYYTLDREGSRTLTREIEFGDETFPVSAQVSAFTDLEVIEGSYTWWFARSERAAFGGTLGLIYLGVDAGIEATALGAGVSAEESASTDLPVPVIGIGMRFGLLETLIFHGYAEFLPSVSVGDVDGSLLNLAAGLEYRPFEHVGFGAAYNYLDIDVDVDRSRYHGSVDYRIQGGQLYLRFGW